MSIFKNEKFEKSLGVILDILFAFVLLFSIFMALSALAQREGGAFGLRLGVVRSKSMEASNLHVGDVVFVNREDDYDVGDIIVFYRAVSQYKKEFSSEEVRDCPIWVHQVVAVSSDEDGRKTYLTKGSSNLFDDGCFVPQDFVIGKAEPLPAFLNKAMGFVRSREGIISLVICPCAAMTIYLVWELVVLLTTRETEAENTGTVKITEASPPARDISAACLAAKAQNANEIEHRLSLPKEAYAKKETFPYNRKSNEFFVKTFMARLVMSDDVLKNRYSAIKNDLLAVSKVKARISKRCETFRTGRQTIAKINVRGKRILLYLALQPQTTEKKYLIIDVSARGKAYKDVPSLFKVNSERGVKYARELICRLAQQHSLTMTQRTPENFAPPAMTAEQMLAAGYLNRADKNRFYASDEKIGKAKNASDGLPSDAYSATDKRKKARRARLLKRARLKGLPPPQFSEKMPEAKFSTVSKENARGKSEA